VTPRRGKWRCAVLPFLALGVWAGALPGCRDPEVAFGEAQIRAGGKTIRVEVARTPAQRERGLMFRDRLPEDEGMLFVFAGPVRIAFWMKNTRNPLSIAFLDRNGRIVDIQDMVPLDPTLHLPLSEYFYALEMNQGWFGRNGVKVGDMVDLD